MKTFIIKDFDEKMFMEIFQWLDTFTNKDKGQIYINSGGGNIWVMYCLLDRLHRLKDVGIDITLRAIYIGSSAFDLFYLYKGNKELEYVSDGIVHKSGIQGTLSTDNKLIGENDMSKIRRKQATKYEDNLINFGRILTSEEYKNYNEGKDVCLSYTRLLEIFNKNDHELYNNQMDISNIPF